MAMAGTAQFSRPPSYPKDGTYADLLFWHLYVWGTRPDGSVRERGKKVWTEEEFLKTVFAGGKGSSEAEPKNYNNWIGDAKNCLSPGTYYGPIISNMLFGGEPQFQIWKNDLEEARGRSGGKGKNNRAITLEAALAELARAGLIDQSADPTSNVFGRNDARRHFAAAARENVALVVSRLTDFFAGRAIEIHAIDEFVRNRMAGGTEGLLVITAPPGFGKSALAAHWCNTAGATPHREISKHFCSISTGEATTSLENIYANLHRQVAEGLGESIDQSGDLDALVALLRNPMPDGKELVVWLDGVDEADGKVECFLPESLGERICVIVSARADEGTIPGYLAPWLADAMAVSHRPLRRCLDKLSRSDARALVAGLFTKDSLVTPARLADRIFRASDQGYALFVRNMAEGAVEAVKDGRHIDLGEAPESLLGYATSELRRLEELGQWPDLQPLFVFLTLAREAPAIDELPMLLGKRVFPHTFPRSFMRWLSLVEAPNRQTSSLLSFAHPLLADIFGQALGYEQRQAAHDLCDMIAAQPYTRWPRYAWRHLPQHYLATGRIIEAERQLRDLKFISERFAALGAEIAPTFMAADWMAWNGVARRDRDIAEHSHASLRHLRFWNNYTGELTHSVRPLGKCAWQQLMHDFGLASPPPHASLEFPQPQLLADSLVTFGGHASAVFEASVLDDGAGFLSWGHDKTLRLWGPAGEERAVLRGHEERVLDAHILADNKGFLSCSADRTLRLWGPAGETRALLSGHTGPVVGSHVLDDSKGFLSWSKDCTLRLWGPNGEARAVMHGHDAEVRGALSLERGTGFLSWSEDSTLRLWDALGEARAVLRGHQSPIRGALILEDCSGFLSWSNDHALRLWGPDGDERAVLRGHTDRINGALTLKNGAGFLSWSDDKTLRLWSPNGEEVAVLWGHTKPVWGALILSDDAGFLSWGVDNSLRLWSRSGEERAILEGHTNPIDGALMLHHGAGFVSYARDNTLRLWGADGEARGTLRGHRDSINGALLLDGSAGILSWSYDGTLRLWDSTIPGSVAFLDADDRNISLLTEEEDDGILSRDEDGMVHFHGPGGKKHVVLWPPKRNDRRSLILEDGSGYLSWSIDGPLRLWGPDGEARATMLGHSDKVEGVMALKGSSGLLSWSDDATLRLWHLSGEARAVLCGHQSRVKGALELEDGSGFLSWSDDHTLRLWGPDGQELATLFGHVDRVNGALALEDNSGFLSWSDDRTLRLWDRAGKLKSLWLSPIGAISTVMLTGDPGHYFVIFEGNKGIVRLSCT